MTTLKEQLENLIGVEGLAVLQEVASSSGMTIEEMVSLEEIDETLGSIEVFSGVSRGPLNFVVLDDDGDEIDLDDLGLSESAYGGYDVTAVYPDTVTSKPLPSVLGAALGKIFEAKLQLTKLTQNKKNHEQQLKKIQTSMTNLGEVFGFDTYEHLEMFMAAWLMKDSTCRLSGIPGTGKTTVIESAAVLLCNSYGHSGKKRYIVSEGKNYDNEARFNQPYVPKEFPAGQNYAIDYSNDAYFSVRDNWNKWRFTPWSANSKVSGSYLYDTQFLRSEGKSKMSIEDFYYLLTNCYTAKVPVQGFNHPDPDDDEMTSADLLKRLPDNEVEIVVAPIQLLDADGNFVADEKDYDFNTKSYTVTSSQGIEVTYTMSLQFPQYNCETLEPTQNYRNILMDRPGAGGYARDSLKDYLVADYGLYTDAGRNEGYNFREFLMEHFYDLRAEWIPTSGGSGKYNDIKSILEEMLREIGVAKIDYEKRADEVLYGIEIRQATKQNEVRGVEESTYEFEPVPRPIVTQPVKFFNEANRSQAGVEDAVLGLIAERKVEYRGRSFDSPNFVAWMDTNPHQKGNDLAFIDRIDMELLFKSISLGARYEQLSGKVLGGGGPPQERLVVKAIEGLIEPIRFGDLSYIWNFVSKNIQYCPPGQTVGSSTYDALREMSYISVLFTQRFQPANFDLKAADRNELTPKDAGYLYASPLMDFSVTTNTNEDGGTKIKNNNSRTYVGQAPSDIGRVLGFRFTNSLQKLSSALAFLRGKSYVTRSEILDALPYVTAHRLGRAKSSKGEISGMKGDELNYNNEQEWIREALVNGYLLQKMKVGDMNEQPYPLLDVWDLYYRRCMDVLRSVTSLYEYESTVLAPLRAKLTGPGSESAGQNFTPVHWHIATMVVDNEKSARNTTDSASKPQRKYRNGDYTNNYNDYLNRVSYNPNADKDTGQQVLFDYYQLRGEICSEPNLFSDDRETLLSLLDSNMAPICGGPVITSNATGIANRIAIANNTSNTLTGMEKLGFSNPTKLFAWRTYQDSYGVWGRLLQANGNSGPRDYSTPNPFDSTQTSGLDYASSFADQALMVSGRLPIRKITSKRGSRGAGSLQKDNFKTQLSNLKNAFNSSVSGSGVLISSVDLTTVAGARLTTINFNDFMTGIEAWAEGYTNRKKEDFGAEIINLETFGDLEGNLTGDGIMACFPLNHAAGAPTGQTDYDGEDQLRLWVRFFMSAKEPDFATLNLSMGVTSNLIGKDKKFLKIDDEDAYIVANYGALVEEGVKDGANISITDSLHYQLVFNTAINKLE